MYLLSSISFCPCQPSLGGRLSRLRNLIVGVQAFGGVVQASDVRNDEDRL